mmetsp:Transcript_13113/g.28984  ORF Transcript_13113/g.28984 Transcript_13113/m.28984 type:complete len:295 (+) Transcript_13113:176-1060(+)
MAFANTNRRTFRGRGGARDGNIPHELSRGNRTARQEERRISNALASNRRRDRERHASRSSDNVATTSISNVGDADLSILHSKERHDGNYVQQGHDAEAASDNVSGDNISDELQKEISHLARRVRNVQESIQLSQAIVNPSTWEQNCLNAVGNCVGEWRAIISFYYYNDKNAEANAITAELFDTGRETSLSVFSLVQMALQSGPLVGSSPGYFKRCGGEVARIALNFLTSEVFTGDLTTALFFTEKQVAAIQKWTKNAEKAAESNKPPSKSMAKLQRGSGKSRAKKEKAENKRSR